MAIVNRFPFFSALAPQVLGSGLQPDLHLLHKVLWDEATNVSFVNGRVRRRAPVTAIYDSGDDAVRGIAQLQDSAGVRWLWAANGNDVVRWYTSSVDAIYTHAAGWTEDETVNAKATFWDLVPYGDWMIMNAGEGKPRIYKPGTGNVTMSDAPSDIVAMDKKLNFILALGYGADKNRVGWSDNNDIEIWTAADDNVAGSLTIAEFDTPIRAARQLGDSIALYAEDQLALLNYVGTPFWFGYKFKLDGIGAVGKAAVASAGNVNFGVSRNGVWWTDGSTVRYLDEGFLHNYLQENVNWEQESKIVACRNDVTRCYDFSFPMGSNTDPSEGWSYDPRVGAWYNIPAFSFKDERRLFSRPIVGQLDGSIDLDDHATSGNSLVLKTKPLLMQMESEQGLLEIHSNIKLKSLNLLLHAATDVEWRVGSCQTVDGDYKFSNWREALLGAHTYTIERGVPSAPYHKLELQSKSTAWDLDFQGFLLFGETEGTPRVLTKS